MKSLLVHMSSVFSDENWSPDEARHLDLTHLEGTTCYCDQESEKAIEHAFKPLPVNCLHWIDGGDYHYLTELAFFSSTIIPTTRSHVSERIFYRAEGGSHTREGPIR